MCSKSPEHCLNSACDNSRKKVSGFKLSDAGLVCSRCETLHEQISPNFWRLVYGKLVAGEWWNS